MGLINRELHFLNENTDSPILLYESGSVCKSLNKQWTTRIEFLCQTDGMSAGPTIVENNNCSLIIHFVTKLVCLKEVVTLYLLNDAQSFEVIQTIPKFFRFNAKQKTFIMIKKLT